MEYKKENIRFFTPYLKREGQNCSFNLFLCLSLATLSGCVTAQNTSPLAPFPPAIDASSAAQNQQLYTPHYFTEPPQNDALQDDVGIEVKNSITPITPKQNSECSLKDRFDRKSILAYEWGRNKISLDIDGVNLKNSGNRGVFIEYKLNIHPEKTKEQRCRTASSWQGLVGSTYNEIFIRKDKKIWSEVTDIIINTIKIP